MLVTFIVSSQSPVRVLRLPVQLVREADACQGRSIQPLRLPKHFRMSHPLIFGTIRWAATLPDSPCSAARTFWLSAAATLDASVFASSSAFCSVSCRLATPKVRSMHPTQPNSWKVDTRVSGLGGAGLRLARHRLQNLPRNAAAPVSQMCLLDACPMFQTPSFDAVPWQGLHQRIL